MWILNKNTIDILQKNLSIIKFVTILFAATIMLGILFPNFQLEFQEQIKNSILSNIEGKGFLGITFFIIGNNATSALLGILFGFIFLPLYSVIFNGYFIGAVIQNAVTQTSFLSIFNLVPHGIFEIPAIIISFSLGIRIGLCWFNSEKLKNFKQSYREALYLYIYLILPLLVIAGVIEGLLFVLN